ncbi:MAG: HAD family hydrolase [Acidimicrobiales bacterium]
MALEAFQAMSFDPIPPAPRALAPWRPRAVIFDFDGLIVETERPQYQAWREAYQEAGEDLTLAQWSQVIGRSGYVDPIAELEARLGHEIDRRGVDARRRARAAELIASCELCPGVGETLDQAADLGLLTAVASSSSADWVLPLLARFGLEARFPVVTCYDGTCPSKPAPELYLKALEALGVTAGEALALEDSENGMQAAKAAGMACVVVPTDMTKHMDFTRADAVIARLGDPPLPELLEALWENSALS